MGDYWLMVVTVLGDYAGHQDLTLILEDQVYSLLARVEDQQWNWLLNDRKQWGF